MTVTITDDEDQDPGIVFTPAGDYVREDTENENPESSYFYFEENNLVVGTASAEEEYTWEVIGTDADLFTFSSEGVLSFKSAPDYENPTDSDQDNTYVVELKATDVFIVAVLPLATRSAFSGSADVSDIVIGNGHAAQ